MKERKCRWCETRLNYSGTEWCTPTCENKYMAKLRGAARQSERLEKALAELVEKAEAFPRVQWKCDCANPDLHEGCSYWDAEKKNAKLEAAIAKAKLVLGEKKKEKQMDTCLLTDEDRTELVQNARNLYAEQMRPSTTYKPRVFPDGNMWCALYGVNIQEGVAGFGESPALAMEDFDANWYKKMEKKGA